MSYERLRAILESCAQLELLQAFEAHTYDDSKLSIITEEVLANKIGIKAGGDRKKILKAIQAALAPQCPPEPTPTTPDPSTAAPPPERIRIFLSYGRRDAAEIAERLHRDLTAAGFEVWRDTQKIRSASLWQDEIEAGLRSAQVVVSLLSPQAVRRGSDGDSTCLDELAYARHHSQPPTPIVPAMVAPCAPPFCICRLDYVHLMEWKSEAVYQAGLKRIIQGIHDAKEGKTSLRTWDAQLRPMDFSDYLHHKRRKFVGREWLFDEIDLWRYESEERALLITGDPGAGKSSVVAQLVHNNSDGQVIGYHCCQSNEIETLRPSRFVQSLAAMIASRLPDYAAQLEVPAVAAALDDKRCESDPSGAFLEGILQPLHALPNPEEGVRYILVDALDEAIGHAGSHTIVDVLASRIERLPPWLRIVATTRKEPLILQKLSALRAKSIDASDPRNLADLGLFVRTRLQGALAEKMTIAKVTSEDVVNRISERSGGNFLYAVNVLDGLERDHFSFNELDKLPQGLNALYLDFFQRIFGRIQGRDLSPEAEVSFQKARPLLEVLIAAREPLTLEELSEASGIHLETELPSLERRLAQILSAPLRGNVRTVALYHKSIADWLALKDHVFFVSAKQGVERLARYTALVLAKTRSNPGWYARRNGVAHCIQTGDWETATTALSDLEFVEARARAKELTAMLEDYGGVLNGLPEMQEQAEIETARKATMRRWAADLAAYTSACIRQRAAGGPKPAFPKPPKAVTFKTDEQIAEECRRIIETPTRVDTLTAFQRFIATQKAPLEAFSEQPGFVAQHAYNDAPEGPVHRAGNERLGAIRTPVITRKWSASDTYNPMHPCKMVLEGHSGSVNSVAISADASIAVSGGDDKDLRVWNLASGKCVHVLRGHSEAINSITVSADNSIVVSASKDNTLRVWNLESGRCSLVLEGHKNHVELVAVSADASIAVSVSKDQSLRVWNLNLGVCARVIIGEVFSLEHSIGILPDASSVFTCGASDNYINFWDLELGSWSRAVKIPSGRAITSVAISGAVPSVFSSSSEPRMDDTGVKKLYVSDLESEHCASILDLGYELDCLGISADASKAVLKNNSTVRIWDFESVGYSQKLTGHSDKITSVAISADASIAVSASMDSTLWVWDLTSGRCSTPKRNTSSLPSFRAINEGASIAISSEDDGILRVWDVDLGTCLGILHGHSGRVKTVKISADASLAVSVGTDGTIRAWDLNSGACLRVLERHSPRTFDGMIEAISADNAQILISEVDRLLVWRPASGLCSIIEHKYHSENYYHAIAIWIISLDTTVAVSTHGDGMLQVWDLATGHNFHTYDTGIKNRRDDWNRSLTGLYVNRHGKNPNTGIHFHPYRVACAAISPDASLVAFECDVPLLERRQFFEEKQIRIFSITSGLCSQILVGERKQISCIAVSPDSSFIVVVGSDHALRIWDLASGLCTKTLEGHTETVTSITISQDASFIKSSSKDDTLRVWDRFTGNCLSCVAKGWGRHTVRNLPLSSFITTASRRKPDPNRAQILATARPACCGKLIEIPDAIAERIDHWTVSGGKGGYKDPALEMPCPQCGTPLKMNPFFMKVR